MTEKLTMNSFHLKEKFPEVYEDFFTKNNLIISCPQVINRGHITHFGGIKRKIAQKMPTKMYLGINLRKDDEIIFQEYTEFYNKEQKFVKRDMEINRGTKLYTNMKEVVRKTLSDFGVKQGVDIMILSENETGTGTAIITVQAFMMSMMAHILGGKLLPQQLEQYEDRLTSKGYKSVCGVATDILTKITNIDKADINQTIMFTAAISHGNMCQSFPSVSFLEEKHPKLFRIDNNACNDRHNPRVIDILEFSIINFGSTFDEFYNKDIYKSIQKEYNDINTYYQVDSPNTSIFQDQQNYLYAKITEAGKNMMINPTNEDTFNSFLDQINKAGSQQVFMEDYMDLYREIVSTFKRNKIFENERLGLIPISSGKSGGTFLCITKIQISRKTIQKMVDELRAHGYPTANITYISREDGISNEIPAIEQYLDQEVISKYIQENDAILEYRGGAETDNGKKTIGKHRELLKQPENSIVFDCIDGKIYINNEPTNHKEILTQSGTVEIMKVIFENMGEYVNNSKLPVSSYTKNKNEIVGKIIGPLQELVKKRFNEKLDLECTGNIVDFDLKLTPSKINLYLLKKIIQ